MIKDKNDRRTIVDRRRYASSTHFPERRAIRFRRSGVDRRRQSPLWPVAFITERRHIRDRAAEKAA